MPSSTSAVPGKKERHFHISNAFAGKTTLCRRQVVNWKGALSCKLARLFTQKIKMIALLPNTHNLENTRDLIKKL